MIDTNAIEFDFIFYNLIPNLLSLNTLKIKVYLVYPNYTVLRSVTLMKNFDKLFIAD